MLDGLRRRLPGLGAIVAAAAALAAATASAGGETRAGAYDGLMFRGTTPSFFALSGHTLGGCAGTLTDNVVSGAATTITPTSSGTSISEMETALYLDSAGNLVFLTGFGMIDGAPFRSTINFFSALPQTTACAPMKPVASSAAGDVYQVFWGDQICDDKSCSTSHTNGGGNIGCVAITKTGTALASTFQTSCNPSAFPALAAGWATKRQVAKLSQGMLDGMVIRSAGNSLTAQSGQKGVCGNVPRVKYFGGADGFNVVQRPRSDALIENLNGVGFGMDVNTKNKAYTWGGTLSLLYRGGTVDVLFNQTNPSASLNCTRRPAPRLYSSSLPVVLYAGPGHRTYIGRATMRTTISGDHEHWAVTMTFGAA